MIEILMVTAFSVAFILFLFFYLKKWITYFSKTTPANEEEQDEPDERLAALIERIKQKRQ